MRPREGETNANDESLGTREPQSDNQGIPPTRRKTTSFAKAIKTLFREAVKALMHCDPAAQPTQRRRRTEDTGRAAFTRTAGKIVCRATTQPVIANAASFMWDTLAWLHLWEWNDPTGNNEICEDFQYAEPQHYLSPHL